MECGGARASFSSDSAIGRRLVGASVGSRPGAYCGGSGNGWPLYGWARLVEALTLLFSETMATSWSSS
jgi:hypothetical protein